jgi:hypothetical protein
MLSPLLAELNVLFDLVVGRSYPCPHVPASTCRDLRDNRCSSAGKCFGNAETHGSQLCFLQRRVKMATEDVRRRDGSSCPSAEQKARLSLADELFEEGRNRRVDINLTKAIRCFESLFDPAVMNFLLGENGQTIWRDVLVDLDAKRLPYSQTSPSRR